ncbi:hypothetical protein Tco_0965761 [Tanacetum coccineum]
MGCYSRVDFEIGEICIDLTMLGEMKDIDVILDVLVENSEDVVKVNGTVKMSALADTRASMSTMLWEKSIITCGAVIDIGRGTLCIDDGVIHHTYFPKSRAKSYLDNFAQEEEEDDWLSCFEVGRDEDGNPKYGAVAPTFLYIEDDMERALAMEAYFNPFKNIIVFKKLIDFLGSLLV